ncbi:MAG: succinylglutamate desuccinylase/aspartoacylase family protein [Gammaproteobacteria bacterium]
MGKSTETLRLPAASPGTRRSLKVHRYRGGSGKKAYIQAAIHADEVPALLVAHHLERRLDALAARGAIRGEIVLVPYANPIGLNQFLLAAHQGRFEADSGRNFNRGYPDLAQRVARRVGPALTGDAARNVGLIRDALRRELRAVQAPDENSALKLELYRRSCDADIVLDLHCDFEALLHLYVGASLWPGARDLAAALGARVTLLCDDSGGAAFDEANGSLWWRLAKEFPDRPIPPACLAATVELRGERDVDDARAARDADAILRFLAGRGLVRGRGVRARTMPAAVLEAVDVIVAPAGGVLTWRRALGARVGKGETIGEIVVPGQARRVPVKSRTAGLLFARRGSRWVKPGLMVAKVAGRKALPWRQPGALLFD